ncbi:MAG: hypothetical protein JRI68_18780 [Deltaproteobacteria bacterium]|nr:hypothetical protein [Deltaproteobacteria bacterium]
MTGPRKARRRGGWPAFAAPWLAALAALSLVGAACTDSDRVRPPTSATGGTGGLGGGTGAGAGNGAGGVILPSGPLQCHGGKCPPCESGTACAEGASETVDESCCAAGDSLVHLAESGGSEVVDIESDGTLAVLCGGFGAALINVSNPDNPLIHGNASDRCQHAAIGGAVDGGKGFYLTHHGDSWVTQASIKTYAMAPDGTYEARDVLSESGVLYEGAAWHDGHLYVAAHQGGLRIYGTASDGVPTYLTSLAGLGNAWKVAVAESGDVLYVVDNEVGLRVVSIVDPQSPLLLGTVPTTGQPRDVHVAEGRVFVAMGGFGVDVFDASDPVQLVAAGTIVTDGSAQAVSADDGTVAVAAWSHVALYDAATQVLVGTEKLLGYPQFEQDIAVAMNGRHVLVGEWEGLHVLEHRPGYVAPDLWIPELLLQFEAAQVDARAVVVENRGYLPLSILGATASHSAFTFDRTELTIAGGAQDYLEITFTPPGPPNGLSQLTLFTNDPDPSDTSYAAGLVTADSTLLNVGDSLDDDFAFLDPNGAGQLSGLEGHVVVLAYFALF